MACCRFGYMLMADQAAALAETRRVLRPGGRLALAVWGAQERNPFFVTIAISLVQHGHLPMPEPTGPPVFSMARAERTTALLENVGFAEVRTEEVGVRFVLPDVDEYLSLIADTAGPLGLALRELSDPDPRRGQSGRGGLPASLRRGARVRDSRSRPVCGGELSGCRG
jgi:SAM-dependent methyltransferase